MNRGMHVAVYLLDEDIWFPPPAGAEEDGLLAAGGDLRPERLLLAYSNGIFPWFNDDEEILWWCPRERFVIFPEEIRISKSLKKFMRKTSLRVTLNHDFDGVIENCRKLALVCLAQYLQRLGFYMIDCQFHTDHLESMGGRFITYEEYIIYVEKGIEEELNGSETETESEKKTEA